MQMLPMGAAGAASLLAVALGIVALAARHRLRIVQQHQQDDELDRQRIRAALERGQSELANANAQVQRRERQFIMLEQALEQQERLTEESREQLLVAQQRYSNLADEQQHLREQLGKCASIQGELQSERKQHEQAKKALVAARSDVTRLQQKLSDARRRISSEQGQRQEQEKQHALGLAERNQLKRELGELNSRLTEANERLSVLRPVEDKAARLEQRISELEAELAHVIQSTSESSAEELDREELQVRLETAAYSVRLAAKQADHYRTRTEQLEAELEEVRGELASAIATALKQERVAAENRALSAAHAQQEQQVESLKKELAELARAAHGAATELQTLRERVQHSERERQALAIRVDALTHESDRAEQLRAELARLSESEHKLRAMEAAHVTLKSELQKAQTALRTESSVEREQLDRMAQLLREEQQSHFEAEQRLLTAQADLRRLQSGAATAFDKRAEVEQLNQLREENHTLRVEIDQLRVHQHASEELERLTTEHKRLRLESELLARRVQELSASQVELAELRRQLAESSALAEEAIQLRDQRSSLEAQLYALGQVPHTRHAGAPTATVEIGDGPRELEARLSPLLAQSGLRSVVLADAGGFPVVVAGDPLVQEGLSAFSALLGEVGQKARQLLPLGDVLLVNLVDVNSLAVSCRLFSLDEERFAVAAIGPRTLDLPRADEVVVALKQMMTTSLPPNEELPCIADSACSRG